MNVRRRFAWPLVSAVVQLGVACADSGGPVIPKTLVITAGDSQAVVIGSALPMPLRVTLTGSDNRPFPGATVNWAVTTGVAAVIPATSFTDSLGQAVTTLVLGNQPGQLIVTATVAGVPPVTFTASALDPCQVVAPYTFGTAVAAALTAADCSVNRFYTDLYAVTIPAPGGITLSMQSPAFDTWLEVYTAAGSFVAFNNDFGAGTNSRIEAIVAPGSYVIAPSSYDTAVTGPYTLSTVARSPALSGCTDVVWLTRGVSLSDSVATTDCLDQFGYYSDRVVIYADSGSVLTIAERSSVIDPYLILYDVNFNLVAFNDDSADLGTTPNAYLVDTLPLTGVYILDIGTFFQGQTGTYTLAIAASSTAASRRAGAVEAAPITLAPLRRGGVKGRWLNLVGVPERIRDLRGAKQRR